MSVGRRLTFLAIAAVIAVVAVVVLGRSPGGGDAGSPPAAEPGRAARTGEEAAGGSGSRREDDEAGDAPAPTATPVPVLRAGEGTRITAAEGERVRFAVRHGAPEEVHVHGYDILREVGPGEPARFAFRATITGRFEVELHGSGEVVGELEVQPR